MRLGYEISLIEHISAVELLVLCNTSELDLGVEVIPRGQARLIADQQ